MPLFSFNLVLSKNNLDSLLLELTQNTNEDTIQVQLLYEIGYEHLNSNPTKSLQYGKEAEILSLKLQYYSGSGLAYKLIADSFQAMNKYDSSTFYYERAINFFEQAKDSIRLNSTYNNYGVSLYYLGNYEQTVYCFTKLLNVFTYSKDTSGLISMLGNLGLVYNEKSDYQKSLDYYFHVYRLETLYNHSKRIGLVFENIGETYFRLEEYDSAYQYISRAIIEYEKEPDLLHFISALNLSGKIKYEKNQLDSALALFQKVIKISRNSGVEYQRGIALYNMGLIHKKQEKIDSAVNLFNEAKTIFQTIGRKKEESEALLTLGELYMDNPKKGMAKKHLMLSLEISKEIGARDIQMKGLYAYSRLKKKQKQYKSSLAYYETFSALKDSLFNEEKSRQIVEIQNRFWV